MLRLAVAAASLLLFSVMASAGVKPFPPGFRTQEIPVDGATLHVRIGGKGPAVVLLHGFGDTGDMWEPLAMHDAFKQFEAFIQDAVDNKALLAKGKLGMPVLAIGGDKSFGTQLPVELGFVANNVTSVVITNSGHWLMEEQPAATMAAIRKFLD